MPCAGPTQWNTEVNTNSHNLSLLFHTTAKYPLQSAILGCTIWYMYAYFCSKYDLDRSMYPKFDSTGVWTHDLQIMDNTFYVPEMPVLTIEPSGTCIYNIIYKLSWIPIISKHWRHMTIGIYFTLTFISSALASILPFLSTKVPTSQSLSSFAFFRFSWKQDPPFVIY